MSQDTLKQRLADAKANPQPVPLPVEARGPAERELIARFQRITNERNVAIAELDLLHAEVLRLQTERNDLAVSNCDLQAAKAELLDACERIADVWDGLSSISKSAYMIPAIVQVKEAIARHGGTR